MSGKYSSGRLESLSTSDYTTDRLRKIFQKHIKFEDLIIGECLGSGCCGYAFKCMLERLPDEEFVVKLLYVDGFEDSEKIERTLKSEGLYLYHANVNFPLILWKDVEIDVKKFKGLSEKLENLGVLHERISSSVLVMRYRSNDLKSYLKENGKDVGYDEVCRILFYIIRGITFLNEHKIVHLDLHEGNLFITENVERVLVGDFSESLVLFRNPTFIVQRKHIPHEKTGSTNMPGSSLTSGGFDEDPETSFVAKVIVDEEWKNLYHVVSQISPEVRRDFFDNVESIDLEKNDLWAAGNLGLYILKKLKKYQKNDFRFEEPVLKFISELIEENPEKRISFEEANLRAEELVHLYCEKREGGRMMGKVEEYCRLSEVEINEQEMVERRLERSEKFHEIVRKTIGALMTISFYRWVYTHLILFPGIFLNYCDGFCGIWCPVMCFFTYLPLLGFIIWGLAIGESVLPDTFCLVTSCLIFVTAAMILTITSAIECLIGFTNPSTWCLCSILKYPISGLLLIMSVSFNMLGVFFFIGSDDFEETNASYAYFITRIIIASLNACCCFPFLLSLWIGFGIDILAIICSVTCSPCTLFFQCISQLLCLVEFEAQTGRRLEPLDYIPIPCFNKIRTNLSRRGYVFVEDISTVYDDYILTERD